MPFTDTPDSVLATLTEVGRTQLSRSTLGEVSFVAKGFAVGREGYDDSNPVKIDPIDASLTALEDQFFPSTPGDIKSFESIERPSPKTLVLNCRLAQSEAVAGLGELGIWAEIVDSNVPSEVGDQFLLAVSHMPIITKVPQQVIVFRLIIQF